MQSVLRLHVVKNRVGLSRSTIYAWIAQGTFPKPISLGDRAVGWLESDINNWIESRVMETRQSSARSWHQIKNTIKTQNLCASLSMPIATSAKEKMPILVFNGELGTVKYQHVPCIRSDPIKRWKVGPFLLLSGLNRVWRPFWRHISLRRWYGLPRETCSRNGH